MYSKVLIVCAVAALAAANDIHQGANNSHGLEPFFKGHYEGQWALTRATNDVFVNTSGIISAINVTDLREAKDGEATIVSGGVGHDNVTINLKSPAVFRGYDFLVEVYSDEDVERGSRGENRGDHEPSSSEVTVEPAAESMPTDKPVTGSTGKPTELSTDKADVTFLTDKPDVTLTPTVTPDAATVSPVTLPGKLEATGLPTAVTGVPKMEMEVPEEIEDVPLKTKVDFHPPTTQF